MSEIRVRHDEHRFKILTASLFLCTAVSLAFVFFITPSASGQKALYRAAQIAVVASSPILLLACVRIFFNSRSASIMALFGCLIALPWFVWTELWEFEMGLNSWITLNLPDTMDNGFILLAKLKILAVFLLLTVLFCSAVRLLPEG